MLRLGMNIIIIIIIITIKSFIWKLNNGAELSRETCIIIIWATQDIITNRIESCIVIFISTTIVNIGIFFAIIATIFILILFVIIAIIFTLIDSILRVFLIFFSTACAKA